MNTFADAMAGRLHSRWSIYNAILVVVGAVLIAISAKLSVPFYPVPLSLQTLVVIGLGFALGPVRGGLAVLLYLAQGAVGLPVFAGSPERGIGLAYMVGPTGGFLVGFVAQAVVAGLLAERGWDRHPVWAAAGALIAGIAIYPAGLLWLGWVIGFDKPVLALGFTPFIFGDMIKAVLAALVFSVAWKAIARGNG